MKIDSIGKHRTAFDGKTNILHTGTEFGEVHPKSPDFTEQFELLQAITGQVPILAPRLVFNTMVTPIIGFDNLEFQSTPGFIRTPELEDSDGVIVDVTGRTLRRIAVMIMNADCGVIQILAPDGRLAVLHGGFDNVDNKDGSSIVTNAVRYFTEAGFNPNELRMSVGEAALDCCYGLNDARFTDANEARAQRITKQYGSGIVNPVRNLPRSANNGIGFNVSLLAARQAEAAGITDIDVETLCTSCHALSEDSMGQSDTYGTWFSNLRENPATTKAKGFGARNAVVVYPAE